MMALYFLFALLALAVRGSFQLAAEFLARQTTQSFCWKARRITRPGLLKTDVPAVS